MKYALEVLFPYIFLLYICDCATYVKAHHVLLTSWFGKKFDIKKPGIRLAGLLPTSQTIITHNLPFHCTPDGVYAVFDEPCCNSGIVKAEDFNFIKFEDLALIEIEGKHIKLNNTHTIKTPSSASARFNAKFINKIKILRSSDRQEKIKVCLSDSFDLEAIKKIERLHSKSFSIIKILSSYLFVLVFFILPTVLYSSLSEYINLKALVISIFLVYFLLLVVTFVTVKKRYKFDNDLRIYTLLSIIFSPVNVLHVMGYLTRDLYFRFNYLALAAYFMPRDAFRELVRKEIFLIDYFENEIDSQDWLTFWKLKKELLQGLLDKCEISLDEISTPPEKQDQTAIYYCPFCLGEYREKRHNCIDCEMALKEFDKGKNRILVEYAG
jgi:hypothetical protein